MTIAGDLDAERLREELQRVKATYDCLLARCERLRHVAWAAEDIVNGFWGDRFEGFAFLDQMVKKLHPDDLELPDSSQSTST